MPTGNIEVPAPAITFGYDSSAPSVVISTPSNPPVRHAAASLATITGTAGVTAPNFLTAVQLRVLGAAGGVWANPANGLLFDLLPAQGDLAWFNASHAGSWANWTASSAPAYVSGSTYTIIARSINGAGTYATLYSSVTVVYDATRPETGQAKSFAWERGVTNPRIVRAARAGIPGDLIMAFSFY